MSQDEVLFEEKENCKTLKKADYDLDISNVKVTTLRIRNSQRDIINSRIFLLTVKCCKRVQ